MITKLNKHGDSWALVIDQPVLDLLQINPDTMLEVRTNGHTLLYFTRPFCHESGGWWQSLSDAPVRDNRGIA